MNKTNKRTLFAPAVSPGRVRPAVFAPAVLAHRFTALAHQKLLRRRQLALHAAGGAAHLARACDSVFALR